MAGAPLIYTRLVFDSTTTTAGTTTVSGQTIVAATNTGWKTTDTNVYVHFMITNIGSSTLREPKIFVSGYNTSLTSSTSTVTPLFTTSTSTSWIGLGYSNADNIDPSNYTVVIGSNLGSSTSTTTLVSIGADLTVGTTNTWNQSSSRHCVLRIQKPTSLDATPQVGWDYQIRLSVKGSYT